MTFYYKVFELNTVEKMGRSHNHPTVNILCLIRKAIITKKVKQGLQKLGIMHQEFNNCPCLEFTQFAGVLGRATAYSI